MRQPKKRPRERNTNLGKPRVIGGEGEGQSLGLWVSTETKRKVEEIAAAEGVKPSTWLRNLVENAVAD